jgi:hypothetical protein
MNALNMRDGESSNFPSSTQPLNPNNPYSPDGKYFSIGTIKLTTINKFNSNKHKIIHG